MSEKKEKGNGLSISGDLGFALIIIVWVGSCLACDRSDRANMRYQECVKETKDRFRCNKEFPLWPWPEERK